MQDLVVERLGPNPISNVYLGSVKIENRFRYNQAFKSIFSMVPTVVVIMLIMIPAIMASIAVVREVETGSMANFRSTPISKLEFLTGKQVPYLVVGMLTFVLMLLMAFLHFPRAGEGLFRGPRARGVGLCFLHVRFRATHLCASPGPRSQQSLQPRLSPSSPR